MDWVELRKHRTPGEYGSFYPPHLIKGHVTYTISPYRQKVMQGVFSDWNRRIATSGKRKLIILTPAILLYACGYFLVNKQLEIEHHEKYW